MERSMRQQAISDHVKRTGFCELETVPPELALFDGARVKLKGGGTTGVVRRFHDDEVFRWKLEGCSSLYRSNGTHYLNPLESDNDDIIEVVQSSDIPSQPNTLRDIGPSPIRPAL